MGKAQQFLIVIALTALLAAFAVHAEGLADARYIVVVGAKAPASDVVTGANFAASMRSAQGVTYSSALDSDAYAQLTDEQVADKTIVVIDGKSVRLLGRNPAAEQYFRQQGFAVEMVDDPTRQDLLVGAPRATATGAANGSERSTDDQPDRDNDSNNDVSRDVSGRGSEGGEDSAPRAQLPPQPGPKLNVEADRPAENTTAPPALTPSNEAQPQREGVLVRVWHWFAGLF